MEAVACASPMPDSYGVMGLTVGVVGELVGCTWPSCSVNLTWGWGLEKNMQPVVLHNKRTINSNGNALFSGVFI